MARRALISQSFPQPLAHLIILEAHIQKGLPVICSPTHARTHTPPAPEPLGMQKVDQDERSGCGGTQATGGGS